VQLRITEIKMMLKIGAQRVFMPCAAAALWLVSYCQSSWLVGFLALWLAHFDPSLTQDPQLRYCNIYVRAITATTTFMYNPACS